MKKVILTLSLAIIGITTYAQSTRLQSGYYKPTTGTYVQPHVKTESNSTNWDNYSTKGNTNLSTGETGTRARDYSTGASNYGSGQTIQTGSRGGQYYINSNGNKTYVPKQ
jgi:hypothetical protein